MAAVVDDENATLDWNPALFTLDSRGASGRVSPWRLDITGPPRALVYGPYICLQAGCWQARVRFTVDAAACGKRLRLEWGCPSDFTIHRFIPGRPGLYMATIEHEWREPAPAETRLILEEGAMDGHLEFLGAAVTRLP